MAGWILFIFSFTRGLVATFLKGEAPFVPTPSSRLPEIVEALDVAERDILYDLGCGDARILVACCLARPGAKYVGYEKDAIPYLWTKFRLWRLGLSEKIKIHRKDFCGENLSEATRIFTYLGPKQMRDLEGKLGKEMKPGARLVSLKFELPNTPPSESFKSMKNDLYVYKY